MQALFDVLVDLVDVLLVADKGVQLKDAERRGLCQRGARAFFF